MNGALPPSSSESFFTVGAHCAINCLPIAVDPVNETFRTSGLLVISAPMDFGSPVITLSTPPGTPDRDANSASASAVSGVASAGLTTIGHPAASAGPTLRVIIAAGKFHGVIAAHTPTGSLTTRRRLSADGLGIV